MIWVMSYSYGLLCRSIHPIKCPSSLGLILLMSPRCIHVDVIWFFLSNHSPIYFWVSFVSLVGCWMKLHECKHMHWVSCYNVDVFRMPAVQSVFCLVTVSWRNRRRSWRTISLWKLQAAVIISFVWQTKASYTHLVIMSTYGTYGCVVM